MISYNQANSVFSYVKKLRKYFHTNPELSGQEENTHLKIISELKKMKVTYDIVDDYSIVAYVNKSKQSKKNIGFRTQIDAIPINNIGDQYYKKTGSNITHSSGHDISTAILLGVIKVIKEDEKKYNGCITFIFEASGRTYKGARNIINSGLIDNLDYLFSYFCTTEFPENTGGTLQKQLFLGADTIEIQWYGQSKPSSLIFDAHDTIMAAANFTDNIRANLAANLSPDKTGIITITKFLSGHTHDLTSNYCELNVNIRYQDNDVKNKIHKVINDTLKLTEARFGVTTKNRVIYSIAPLMVNKEASDLARSAFTNIKPDLQFVLPELTIYSESFSLYGDKAKCSFGFYGAKNLALEPAPASSEYFSPNEESFKIGIAWYLETAAQYLT